MPSEGFVVAVATGRIATTDIAAFAGCGLIRRLGGWRWPRHRCRRDPYAIYTQTVRLEMQVLGGDAPSGSEMRNDRQAEQTGKKKLRAGIRIAW